jgi:serine/threonine-protein kinase
MDSTLFASRYEILFEIGSGGMAKVFKARDTILNRIVAIKILRSEFADDAEFTARFTTEAQAAAGLSHQNLVSIFDVGSEGGTRFIVMEYVDGITLKEYIRQQKMLEWQEAIKITTQILMGISHAHDRGIVHRDIKPQNIVITPTGLVKVMDFGIARATSSYTLKVGDATIGSVHYFSPEQARGRHTDEKSDIYSLGIVLYELMTGHVPFDGDSPIAVAMMHLQNMPISPKEFNVSVPLALEEIVMKAIRKEPHERYRAAKDMLADLYAAQDNPNRAPTVASGKADSSGDTRVMEPIRDVPFGMADSAAENPLNDKPTPYVPKDRKILKEQERKRNEGKPPQEKKRLGSDSASEDELSAKEKKLTTWAIIAGGFLIFSAVFLTLLALFPNMFRSQNVEVIPSFIGRNIQEVREEFDDDERFIINEMRRAHESAVEDIIFDQDPPARRRIRNTPINITLFVSSGIDIDIETFTLRDYVGKDEVTSAREMDEMGLVLRIEQESSATVAEGLILRTIPRGGASVQTGDEITVFVSRGRGGVDTTMPSLMGLTLNDARRRLEQHNLELGDFTMEDSTSAINTVIGQSVAVGATVPEFSAVDVVLSSGRAPATPTPAQTNSAPYLITIPQTSETTHIRVTANGVTIHDRTHNREERTFNVTITGSGAVSVQVFFDGELRTTGTVNL